MNLFSGENTITFTALGNSAANLDSIEIFPNSDQSVGRAFVEVDKLVHKQSASCL